MEDMTVRNTGAAAVRNRPAPQLQSPSQEPAVPETGKEPLPDMERLTAQAEEQSKSLYEMMKEAREKSEARKKLFKLSGNANYGNVPMMAYARLAKARTHADVNAAAGYARRNIFQLKAALRRDPDNADRIRAAIGQLQKAVSRAGKKRRDLDREGLAERRRTKAMEEDRRREAQRLRAELQRRRAMRSIRESGYLREAEIDNRFQLQMAMAREEYRLQAQSLPTAAPEVAARQYLAMAEPPAPAAPPAGGVDIQV